MSTSYKKSWVLCLSGSTNALKRVNEAIEENQPDAKVLQPLSESLWWICAADESLKSEYGGRWTKHLRPHLDCLEHLQGLRWVRNRITHQICHWEIATLPFVWEKAETLAPSKSVAKSRDHGRSEYKSCLEGRDAREAIKLAIKEIRDVAMASLPAQI